VITHDAKALMKIVASDAALGKHVKLLARLQKPVYDHICACFS
jgi:hypothetical protein